eukprot:TRINITY_DN533_c1_g2_i1.p1 TRINITY_DN533_c1_g2~~TRINITY_DN533_c1_g2_i1.p1  ORF type:complete len:147 (-),score=22.84 TRINITY_DN533_c1_g2_i1:69-509(-)
MGLIIWMAFTPDNWSYLGHIHNERPSGFFHVNQSNATASPAQKQFGVFTPQVYAAGVEAQIGVEVANLKEIEHQFGSYEKKKITPETQTLLAQKIAENAVNYLDSFAFELRDNNGTPCRLVKMDLVTKWYDNLLQKLRNNPNWWRK